MQTGNRIILNTAALYVRNIVKLLITLWSVPLVLHALGESDFGLYNLVAGIIAMLAFLNGAMTVSTQRYLSVNMGKNDVGILNNVYNTSMILHIIIGVATVLLFEMCGFFLFDGFLNIDPSRMATAKLIYQFLIASTFLTIITVPFNALITANEDLFAFSLIGIVDSLLQLGLAYFLFVVTYDRLNVYAMGIALITVLNVIISRIFVHVKYNYISFNPKKYYTKGLMKEMFAFSGWNTFGSLAMVARSQGIAIIVNKFFNTAINAAYGVANQIQGGMYSFSSVLQQSINPQLMKSEGMSDRERMLKISYISSKLSTMIVLIMAVPLIIEMPYILKIWLRVFPPYTVEFSRWILALAIVNQYSVGIMSAIQAGGRIGKYQFTMSIFLLTNIPLSILLLYFGCPPYSVAIGMLGIEVITLYVRLTYAKKLVGYNIAYFIFHVIGLSLIPALIAFFLGATLCLALPQSFVRLLFVILVSLVAFLVSSWMITLNNYEKDFFRNIFNKVLNLTRKHHE